MALNLDEITELKSSSVFRVEKAEKFLANYDLTSDLINGIAINMNMDLTII